MDRWTPYVKEAAQRFNIAEDWIMAVMRMESGGRTEIAGKPITSQAGAVGIMQVMPATYEDMRAQYGLGKNPYDPHDNVLAGAAYLSWLRDRYGYPKMFAAYNAGPGTLDAQMAGRAKLPAETVAYVKGITRILADKSNASPDDKPIVMEAIDVQRRAGERPSDRPAVMEAIDVQPSRVAKRASRIGEEAPRAGEQPSRISVTYLPADPVATLTRPDGSTVAVESATVDSIRPSLPDEYAPGVQTVISMGSKRQGVREAPATVSSLLNRQVGSLQSPKRA
jgi:hypothetical protein